MKVKSFDLKNFAKKYSAKFDLGSNTVLLSPDKIVSACESLKKDYGFDHLSNLTAVDYKDSIEIVYNIFSYSSIIMVNFKVRLDTEKPTVDSVSSVYPTANWQEREVYDFFGVRFNNHPDLRRLFLVDNFPGHPLRKKVKLEYDEEFILEDD